MHMAFAEFTAIWSVNRTDLNSVLSTMKIAEQLIHAVKQSPLLRDVDINRGKLNFGV